MPIIIGCTQVKEKARATEGSISTYSSEFNSQNPNQAVYNASKFSYKGSNTFC